MWKRLREFILRDVENENEIKMYAVTLRLNLLVMLLYYGIAVGKAVQMSRHGASAVAVLGILMCLSLFYATYCNCTKLAAYVFHISFVVLIIAYALMYGNYTSIYNFIYIQIVLLYALDYVTLKWKVIYVAAMILLRMGLFTYLQRTAEIYPLGESERLFWQGVHMFIICLLLMATVSVSTQDFREMQKKLVTYNQKLRNIAGRDPLTGLRNRRSAMEYIGEKARAYQQGESNALTIAIGDIDFFKKINDTYGHNCGDVVLKELADVFRSYMEGKGEAARWGGEEFLFIFNNINGDDASYMLSELRNGIHKMRFQFGEDTIGLTMTFGVAEYDLRKGTDANIEEADEKLYYGKEKGRDIVIY